MNELGKPDSPETHLQGQCSEVLLGWLSIGQEGAKGRQVFLHLPRWGVPLGSDWYMRLKVIDSRKVRGGTGFVRNLETPNENSEF